MSRMQYELSLRPGGTRLCVIDSRGNRSIWTNSFVVSQSSSGSDCIPCAWSGRSDATDVLLVSTLTCSAAFETSSLTLLSPASWMSAVLSVESLVAWSWCAVLLSSTVVTSAYSLCTVMTSVGRVCRSAKWLGLKSDVALNDDIDHIRIAAVAAGLLSPVYTIQPVVNRIDSRLYRVYSRLSNRLSNGFDNRLDVCLHNTAGCNRLYNRFDKTGCITGLTTGCIV